MTDAADVIVHGWRHEQFTSPTGVEALAAYELFGHEAYQHPHMGGRFHWDWASTETAQQAPGHIEGALWSGSRSTNAVLTTLTAPT